MSAFDNVAKKRGSRAEVPQGRHYLSSKSSNWSPLPFSLILNVGFGFNVVKPDRAG